jgi:hypothetical protein
MFKLTRKIFTNMYPRKLKPALTAEGQWLRKCVGWSTVLHIIFFAFSLAFVGFLPMISNLFLATFGYSVFLTLRECEVVVYLVTILSAISGGFFDLMHHKDNDASQKMGLIVMMASYVWVIYYLCRAYYFFRKSGGIKGSRIDNQLLLEEKLAKNAGKFGNKGLAVIDKALDLEMQKERYNQNEAKRMAIL